MVDHDSAKLEQGLQSIFREAFVVAGDIDALCESLRVALKQRHQTDFDPGSLPHNILFVRAWRLWQAVICLARQGYAIEAIILTRAIWETRVQLGYLCAQFETRTLQFRRHVELFSEARLTLIAQDDPEVVRQRGIPIPDSGRVAQDIRDFIAAYGEMGPKKSSPREVKADIDVMRGFLRKNWMLRRLDSAAESFGAKTEYEALYPPMSRSAHGGFEGLTAFTWYENGFSIIEAGPSFKRTSDALVTGGIALVAAVQEIDNRLELGFADSISQLNQRLGERLAAIPDEELRLVQLFQSKLP